MTLFQITWWYFQETYLIKKTHINIFILNQNGLWIEISNELLIASKSTGSYSSPLQEGYIFFYIKYQAMSQIWLDTVSFWEKKRKFESNKNKKYLQLHGKSSLAFFYPRISKEQMYYREVQSICITIFFTQTSKGQNSSKKKKNPHKMSKKCLQTVIPA